MFTDKERNLVNEASLTSSLLRNGLMHCEKQICIIRECFIKHFSHCQLELKDY